MKSIILGLGCGLLLAVSAIAGEQPLSNWFKALDQNGNGDISLVELQTVRNQRFSVLDANRDNVISTEEVAGSVSWSQRFFRLDHNSDGYVNLAEFEANGRSRFAIIDIDDNGKITSHEAINFQNKSHIYVTAHKVSG